MAMNTVSQMMSRTVMGFYYYFAARFFAGLFLRTAKPILSRL